MDAYLRVVSPLSLSLSLSLSQYIYIYIYMNQTTKNEWVAMHKANYSNNYLYRLNVTSKERGDRLVSNKKLIDPYLRGREKRQTDEKIIFTDAINENSN